MNPADADPPLDHVPLNTARAAALAGTVFAGFFVTSLLLIDRTIPCDPQ